MTHNNLDTSRKERNRYSSIAFLSLSKSRIFATPPLGESIFKYFIFFLVFSFLITGQRAARAAESFVVKLGESKTFTTLNYFKSWTEILNPNGVEPQWEEFFDGTNTARIGTISPPNHNGRKLADMGIKFDWDFGGLPLEAVASTPVKIIITFSYSLEAIMPQQTGSADASLRVPGPSFLPWYQRVDSLQSDPPKSETMKTVSFDTNVGAMQPGAGGNSIFFRLYTHAHTVTESSTTNEAYAELTVHSITIQVGPHAEFSLDPPDPQAGEAVHFINRSSGDNLTYQWTITDIASGAQIFSSTDREFTQSIFSHDSVYWVSLKVSDGSLEDEKKTMVTVSTPDPQVKLFSPAERSLGMGVGYDVCYDIKNPARVPVFFDIKLIETQSPLFVGYPWDPTHPEDRLNIFDMHPFKLDEGAGPDNPSSAILCLPKEGDFVHKWYWLNPQAWIDQMRFLITKFSLAQLAEFLRVSGNAALADIIEQIGEVYEPSIGTNDPWAAIPNVKYTLADNGTMFRHAGNQPRPIIFPSSSTTVQVDERKRQSLQAMYSWFKIAEGMTELGFAVDPEPGLPNPPAIGFFAGEGAAILSAQSAFLVAKDPPDANFTEIAIPQPVVWPEIASLPDGAPKQLAEKFLDLLSLKRAHNLSHNRFEGAEAAGDGKWRAAQLQAASGFSRAMAEGFLPLVDLFESATQDLPAMNDADIEMAKNELAQFGLPQLEVDILTREIAISQEELSVITEALIASDTWALAKETFPIFTLHLYYTAQVTAALEALRAAEIRVSQVGEPVRYLTPAELAELQNLKRMITESVQRADFSNMLIEAIRALQSTADELLVKTNNPLVIRPFYDAARDALLQFPINFFLNGADTTPPNITRVTASPNTLWPPNHKMVNIVIKVSTNNDSVKPLTLTASVTSNEPQNGLGDGDMAPDWTAPVIDQANGVITLQLRAERSGNGNGRVYTVFVTATDFSGNTSTASVEIIVPHDKSNKHYENYKTIIINGDYEDWDEKDRVYLDTDGPECGNAPGQDIKEIYVAQDNIFVYLRYIMNGPLDESFGYKFGDILHTYVGQKDGKGYIFYGWPSSFDINNLGYELSAIRLPDSYVAVTGNQFEAKFLKRDVRIWKHQQLKAWSDQGYQTVCRDYIVLPPLNLDLP